MILVSIGGYRLIRNVTEQERSKMCVREPTGNIGPQRNCDVGSSCMRETIEHLLPNTRDEQTNQCHNSWVTYDP
jgi:hypothetical protein